tara:strand:- start:16 stop:801 length:786 start_codon:yes stop_codon:yes gene_type:complete
MRLNGKLVAIVQARMGSSRLPGKVLKSIQGKPMLWHIVDRIKSVTIIDEVIIATTDLSIDDPVANMALSNQIPCFRGSESNVLNRFFLAAKKYDGKHLIRITGDCPLIDPNTIETLINYYNSNSFEYCSVACGAGVAGKGVNKRYPDGLDTEIFSFNVLNVAENEAISKLHLEHVTPFIWKQPDRFNLGLLFPEKEDFSQYRWTVDNDVDFEFIEWVYDKLYSQNYLFSMKDVLKLIFKNRDSANINKHFVGKEGYEEFWE